MLFHRYNKEEPVFKRKLVFVQIGIMIQSKPIILKRRKQHILQNSLFTWLYAGLLLSILLTVWLVPGLSAVAAPRVQPLNEKVVIVIDPGHGGINEGTIENGFLEKSMTLITAQAMYDELSLYDNVEVYMTRTEDIDLSIEARAKFAAAVKADFLFSIHYNASVDHDLFGSEVWIPAKPPYNAYGYQFAYEQMLTMQDMGLFLRGIKTKLNDRGTDYYGIIRESAALSVPAVIIEHCHVDEDRDVPFCDDEEDLIAFGKADALSVAKYFGLKSSVLGVDYSGHGTNLAAADEAHSVQSTLKDETAPDVCMLELLHTEADTGMVSLQVTAADYDSPLIYYDYSIDTGLTYSPLQPWPKSNALEGTYQDTFTLDIQIPSGTQANIIVRAYNLFDACTESEPLTILQTFRYGEDEQTENSGNAPDSTPKEEKKLPGTETFLPANAGVKEEESGQVDFLSFLKICLIIVIILFIIILVSQNISYRRRRKKLRQRRKDSGNRSSQPR